MCTRQVLFKIQLEETNLGYSTTVYILGVQDQLVDALSLLHERAEQDEPNSLFSLINDLSKVLCKKVSGDNLWSLVVYLLEGLVDYQAHSSSGACVVLNQIVKLRGKSLEERVGAIAWQFNIRMCLFWG